VALVGLGGVGKSQLAIEHCYRIFARSPRTWVFWVHANNAERLDQGFRAIADKVKARGRKDPQVNIYELVDEWLHNNGPWHLVIDNADDDEVLSPLSGYLASSHGSVLVTSRTEGAAGKVVDPRDFISVGTMDAPTAHTLLLKNLRNEGESDYSIAELAKELEFMPLALMQAAAYIRRRAPRCSVQQYLEKYRQSDSSKTSLLNQEAGQLRRDGAASNSVLSTWQITFEYISGKRPSAADLLSLMSFFDRQGIQEAFLRSPNSTMENSMADDGFEDDILTLREFSIIKVTSDANTFEMHSLVQLATRKWLEHRGQTDIWQGRFITRLRAEMPSLHRGNYRKLQALLPHAKAAFAQRPKDMKALEHWVSMLTTMMLYSSDMGRFGEAQRMWMVFMEFLKKTCGEEDQKTIIGIYYRGELMMRAGKFEEAEAIFRSTLRRAGILGGAEHPFTRLVGGRLVVVLTLQGRYQEAEPMARKLLAQAEKIQPNEPDTLRANIEFVFLQWRLGKCEEAESSIEQTLASCKTQLGLEHPVTLEGMHYLSIVKRAQGRYEEAASIARHLLVLRKKLLPPSHPDTLSSMGVFADALRGQCKYREAELILRELALQKELLGSEHPSTIDSVHRLAYMLAKQLRFEESQVLYKRACAGYSNIYGEDDERTHRCRDEYTLMLAIRKRR
jgi:tetratricopeptide (TPR) repeat protein